MRYKTENQNWNLGETRQSAMLEIEDCVFSLYYTTYTVFIECNYIKKSNDDWTHTWHTFQEKKYDSKMK